MATFRSRLLMLHEETGKTVINDAMGSELPTETFRKLMTPSYPNMPSINSINQLAKHYNVSIDYLLGVSEVRREYGS